MMSVCMKNSGNLICYGTLMNVVNCMVHWQKPEYVVIMYYNCKMLVLHWEIPSAFSLHPLTFFSQLFSSDAVYLFHSCVIFRSLPSVIDAVGWATEEHPACKKLEWWGNGMVGICLEQDADLHMVQLMSLPPTVSCSSKIQNGFTIFGTSSPCSPGQRAVKWVCVCVCNNCYNFLQFKVICMNICGKKIRNYEI